MEPAGASRATTRPAPVFDVRTFLASGGAARTVANYSRGETIFRQGDSCADVLYVKDGGVKLSVMSKTGREAVVAMLGPGDFFGEGCLAGQSVRVGSATALTSSTILRIRKRAMARLLHEQHDMSDRFISHMLARNIRIEEDLVDQLINTSEKRLARTLLLLAHYGTRRRPSRVLPDISQETLAEMIGTTPSRVSFFLSKFKKLGFIDYTGERPITVRRSLLSVVLHD